ncbi:MAG: L,D-transpeptidase [Deltaproteobacteria bacterium]|nr:L,D-transpeptidase [Deltaproteobacteria bacterium]
MDTYDHQYPRWLAAMVMSGVLFFLPFFVDATETIRMRTVRQIVVYGSPNRGTPPVARINYGAVLEVEKITQYRGCKKGWGRLQNGGYLCLSGLRETALEPAVAPSDNPDIDAGIDRYIVGKGGANSFPNRQRFGQRQPGKFLYKGTVLAVKDVIVRGGTRYLITRDGQYIQGDNVEKMSPVVSLGHEVVRGKPFILGYVINDNAVSHNAPDEAAGMVQTWRQFDPVMGTTLLTESFGWVSLPDGSHMRDDDVGRVRLPSISFTPEPNEKWIAVDLAEQIVTAYEGTSLVYIALASTGKKGNTEPGNYRVKWKRRLQTMNMYGGHLRVDDVQWVMYYIPKRGFALHSAWHRNFGHPVSHGCVNLPSDDARWLYEWTTPTSWPFESEDFDTETEKGTRVIVF